MTSIFGSEAWENFAQAAQAATQEAQVPVRLVEAGPLKVDLSLQFSSTQLTEAANVLLEEVNLPQAKTCLFNGDPINWTENRSVLHTALRGSPAPEAISLQVAQSLGKMASFVDNCNRRNLYRNIVHLGIGGSDWGPRMIWEALRGQTSRRSLRFAANIDSQSIWAALDGLNPADTLIVIASKSFTTLEAMANARIALQWMHDAGVADPLSQTVALTANPQVALEFGVPESHIFEFWDWVGGRYSLWSSIGLSLALALGWRTFTDLHAGARAMDRHFLEEPVATNAPVQMALSSVINSSVLGFTSEVICPYDARLAGFVMWLQQLNMESLGKHVDHAGQPVRMKISPAIWGMPGTDSQHTFFQWLHQHQQGAPVDFIVRKSADGSDPVHHRQLLANCLAQRAALWKGQSLEEATKLLRDTAMSEKETENLAPHLVHPGRRPSTLIVLPALSAKALGALAALYEHKVFVQGVLWNINPFDQWGVEFGKKLAQNMVEDTHNSLSNMDPSTQHWIQNLLQEENP